MRPAKGRHFFGLEFGYKEDVFTEPKNTFDISLTNICLTFIKQIGGIDMLK